VLRSIYYWSFRKVKGYPSKAEIRELCTRTPIRHVYTLGIALDYSMFAETSVESLAKERKVTEERIKQILWKFHRVDRTLKLCSRGDW